MAGKKVLVLGSGMVVGPCVEYLTREGNSVTVASRNVATAEKLVESHSRAKAIQLDVTDNAALEQQIAGHDLAISLVPFAHHACVIKAGIKQKTHIVTTSYVSPTVQELDGAAKAAGIVVLNEVGVDPGLDHCYAIKTISEVHAKGGKVKEFYSYCGGLPAPECSDNPLRFKFSWSPRGALLSQYNPAKFIQGGREIEVRNIDLMAQAKPYFVKDGYSFVAYPNRNSVLFRDFYKIPEADTVIRGTLRYQENPAFVRALIDLGWLDTEKKPWLKNGLTWAEIQQNAISVQSSDESFLLSKIDQLCTFSNQYEKEYIISGLRWIGILSKQQAPVRSNLLDTLCARLAELISFQPGERDLVMLQHKFVVEWSNGEKDTLTSTLELFGWPNGYSAMAKSVGTTCGIATQLLLSGLPSLQGPGIVTPYTEDICGPIREQLEKNGLTMVERKL